MQLRAIFNQKDINKIIKAADLIEATFTQEQEATPRTLAVNFAVNLRNAIHSQKYPWKELGPKYSEWKRRKVGYLDHWKLYTNVIVNTQFWSFRKGEWCSGIPAGIGVISDKQAIEAKWTHKEYQSFMGRRAPKPKFVGAVAFWNEYGWRPVINKSSGAQSSRKVGERPLLRPTFRDFVGREVVYRETLIVNKVHRAWRNK